MSGIAFDSRKNYLKIADPEGVKKIVTPKPSTADFLTFFSTVTINHNLGYRPMVRAWFSPGNNDTWYPMDGEYDSFTDIMGVAGMNLYVQEITTTTVTFRAQALSSMAGQNYTLAYKIYLDPTT